MGNLPALKDPGELNEQGRSEGQAQHAQKVEASEGMDQEQALHGGDKQHQGQQQDTHAEGHQGVGVAAQAQLDDGLLTPAVEAVEQAGQGEGGKGHVLARAGPAWLRPI